MSFQRNDDYQNYLLLERILQKNFIDPERYPECQFQPVKIADVKTAGDDYRPFLCRLRCYGLDQR